ncbi:MAG: hypothetical protein QHH02_06850 [Syntrophomonadaceae bacterium]|nr:hypothetical protein [Syntrophomonadaceae bacterium]
MLESSLLERTRGDCGDSWTQVEEAVAAGRSVVSFNPRMDYFHRLAGRMNQQEYRVLMLNASYSEMAVQPVALVNWNPIVEIRNNVEMDVFVNGIVKDSRIEFNLLTGLESMLLKSLIHIVKSGTFPQKINTLLCLLNLAREKIVSIFEDLYEEGKFSCEETVILKQWLTSLPISDIDRASENLITKLNRLNKYESLNALDQLIDFTSLGVRKTAVFVQTPAILDYCSKKVLSLMTSFLLRRLYEKAEEMGGKLPVGVSIFREDAEYHIEKIPDAPGIVDLKRSLA